MLILNYHINLVITIYNLLLTVGNKYTNNEVYTQAMKNSCNIYIYSHKDRNALSVDILMVNTQRHFTQLFIGKNPQSHPYIIFSKISTTDSNTTCNDLSILGLLVVFTNQINTRHFSVVLIHIF